MRNTIFSLITVALTCWAGVDAIGQSLPVDPPAAGSIYQRTRPNDWEFKGVFMVDAGYYDGRVVVGNITSSLDSFQNAVIGIQNIANGVYGNNDFVLSTEGTEVGNVGMEFIPTVGVEVRYLRKWGMGILVGPSAYERKAMAFELWGSFAHTLEVTGSNWAFMGEARLGLGLDQGKALSPNELVISMNHDLYQDGFAPLFFELGTRDSIPYADRLEAANALSDYMDTYVRILGEEVRRDKHPRGGGFMLMTEVAVKAQVWPNIRWASLCIEAGPYFGLNNMSWIRPQVEKQNWHYGFQLGLRIGPP